MLDCMDFTDEAGQFRRILVDYVGLLYAILPTNLRAAQKLMEIFPMRHSWKQGVDTSSVDGFLRADGNADH